MNKRTYDAKSAKLSPAATRLLAKLEKGEFFPTFTAKSNTSAMAELVRAGLVKPVMRVTRLELCHVPAFGYTPAKQEKFAKGA